MNVWLETIGTVATVLAVTGVVLNNHKRLGCFYLWLVSNALCLICHVWLAAWSMAARDAIFWALAIYGLIAWRRPRRAKERVCDAYGVELEPGEDAELLDGQSLFTFYGTPGVRPSIYPTRDPAAAARQMNAGCIVLMR